MPQPTVRQLTARRLVENAATTAMKQTTPAAACTRGPIDCRAAGRRHAPSASASRRSARAAASRSVGGGGGAGSVMPSGVLVRRVVGRSPIRVEHQRPAGRRRVADGERARSRRRASSRPRPSRWCSSRIGSPALTRVAGRRHDHDARRRDRRRRRARSRPAPSATAARPIALGVAAPTTTPSRGAATRCRGRARSAAARSRRRRAGRRPGAR